MPENNAKVVRCIRCNRPLTDPESVKCRIGPVCLAKLDKASQQAVKELPEQLDFRDEDWD